MAVDADGPAGGRENCGEHLDGGGFAGPVGTEEAEDLSLRHGKGDVIDGGDVAEGLDQVANVNHFAHRYILLSGLSQECRLAALVIPYRTGERACRQSTHWDRDTPTPGVFVQECTRY